jgi:hypothetical protein
MWMTLLFIGMFVVGLIVLIIRLNSGKAIKKASRLLEEDKPDKHVWGQTIASLDIIGTDEAKELAKKMRTRLQAT